MTATQTYTLADMARAWREGRATRALYDGQNRANPDEPCPYDDVPVSTDDWSIPERMPTREEKP